MQVHKNHPLRVGPPVPLTNLSPTRLRSLGVGFVGSLGTMPMKPTCPEKNKCSTSTTPAPSASDSTSSTAPKAISNLSLGLTVGSELVREVTVATLISEGVEMATFCAAPLNLSKCRATLLINGASVEAYRDTCASVTMVTEALVCPEQYMPGR